MTLPKRIFRPRKKDTRLRSPQHLQWIRTFACCVPMCNEEGKIEAHHVKGGEPMAMGRKPGDQWTVSLCVPHHREMHNIGIGAFELCYSLDLLALAREFASQSPALKRLERTNQQGD